MARTPPFGTRQSIAVCELPHLCIGKDSEDVGGWNDAKRTVASSGVVEMKTKGHDVR